MRRWRGFEGRLTFIALSIAAAIGFSGCDDDEQNSSSNGAGGDGGSSSVGSTASASSSGAGGSGGAGGGAGGSGGSGGSVAPVIPACRKKCSTEQDCVLNAPLYTIENWACSQGICDYLGCMGDKECQDTLGANYLCKQVSGSIPACYQACSAPADCATPSPIADADNYACNAGLCEWLGCNTTDECAAAMMTNNHVCEAAPGFTVKTCRQTCSAPADCAPSNNALQDADNYACTAMRCQYLGCNSTAECEAALMNMDYVCK